MPRMSEREKEEWELFLNPNTGRKNYNGLCKKCQNDCKQSFRVTVVECRRFDPIWGRKKDPDSSEPGKSKGAMQHHYPISEKLSEGKESGKNAPNIQETGE